MSDVRNQIIESDNLVALAALPDSLARLVYIDPPFNTRKTQKRQRIKATRDKDGDRKGFGGAKYKVEKVASGSYGDTREDFIPWLLARVEASLRCMTDDASLMVHLDYREVHYAKVALDGLLGRECFQNELIWAYDFGGRSKRKWSAKHDSILWYTRDPKRYVFNFDEMDRIPYMAPGLVGKEKAARGKTPTDVWWHTIVPTNGKEKTGYPTQKPMGVLERIIKVHSDPGDVVLDFFAGSGTTGDAAAKHGRRFVLIDENPEAIEVMKRRLDAYL